MKKYVMIIDNSGKTAAVGSFKEYYGKWIVLTRNDNEEIAVNTDFVRSIHFMDIPTQKMLDAMARTSPTLESVPSDEPVPKIAVKSTSGKVDTSSVDDIIQNLVDSGPPGMQMDQSGAGIFSLPSSVKLPVGVDLDDDGNERKVEVKRRLKRKKK